MSRSTGRDRSATTQRDPQDKQDETKANKDMNPPETPQQDPNTPDMQDDTVEALYGLSARLRIMAADLADAANHRNQLAAVIICNQLGVVSEVAGVIALDGINDLSDAVGILGSLEPEAYQEAMTQVAACIPDRLAVDVKTALDLRGKR